MAIKVSQGKTKTYKYVPLSEREDEKPFSVTIRPLSSRELAILEDKLIKVSKDETISFNSGSFNWDVCKHGIVDWENLTDEKGKQVAIKVKDGLVTDESLNKLPLYIITEVAGVITSISKDPENAELFIK